MCSVRASITMVTGPCGVCSELGVATMIPGVPVADHPPTPLPTTNKHHTPGMGDYIEIYESWQNM